MIMESNRKMTPKEQTAYNLGFNDGKAEARRWISVKDRLPKNGEKVIATFVDTGGRVVAQARYIKPFWDFASWVFVSAEKITHWMPMPEPPKED